MKLPKILEKYASAGFWQFILLGLGFVVIIFVEKQFFPSATALVQFNVFGRSSVVLPLLMILIFFAWTKDRLFAMETFKWNWLWTGLFALGHFAAYFGFIWLKDFIITDTATALEYFNWIVAARYALPFLIVLFLALALFTIDFFREYWKELLISLVLAYVFFHVSMWFKGYWRIFSDGVTYVVVWVLQLLGQEVSVVSNAAAGPTVNFGSFALRIESPCSGVESMSLFSLLYALIVLVDRKKIRWGRAIIAYIPGVIVMYLVNVFRIVVLFLIAIYYDYQFAIHTFHTNAGWILFIIYFGIFWSLAFRFITKKEGAGKGNVKKSDGKKDADKPTALAKA